MGRYRAQDCATDPEHEEQDLDPNAVVASCINEIEFEDAKYQVLAWALVGEARLCEVPCWDYGS